MLYSELRKKEVINMPDCRKLGHVVDMDIDERKGCIRSLKVSEKWCCFNGLPGCCTWLCGEPEYTICYSQIKQIGPDIIIVELCC